MKLLIKTEVKTWGEKGFAAEFNNNNYARASFPHLWEKTVALGYESSEPKYKITLLIPKGSDIDKTIRKSMAEAARLKWGKNFDSSWKKLTAGAPDYGSNKALCYRDGDLDDNEASAGHMKLIASTSTAPLVIGPTRQPLEKGSVYGGCYVNAQISLYIGNTLNIAAILHGVQFVANGEPLGGGVSAKPDDFPEIEDNNDPFDK